MKKRHATTAAIILIFSVGMAGISPLLGLISPVAAQSPPAGNGYICRQNLDTQYHTDSDIRPVYIAYYSQGGRYVPRPVTIQISISYAGIHDVIKKINATINDNKPHNINIGRLSQGTYTITAVFSGASITMTGNIEVLHPPIKYTLTMNGGDFIRFRSNHGNFTIRIYEQIGQSTHMTEYTNASDIKYYPPSGIITISVYVVDRYGNENGLNNGQPYVWVYAEGKNYQVIRITAAAIIGIIALLGVIRIYGGLSLE